MKLSSILLPTCVTLLGSTTSVFAWDSEPVPDYVVVPSAECTSCRNTIDGLEMKWTNETEVAEILSDLQRQCKTQDSLMKKKFCDAAVQVLVQLPAVRSTVALHRRPLSKYTSLCPPVITQSWVSPG